MADAPVEVPQASPKAATVTQEQFDELQETVEQMRTELNAVKKRQEWTSRFALRFTGYLDFGFFWVQGNGSGVRPDYDRSAAPQLAGQIPSSWVLRGDPLSTTINSRGDVADVGDSRAIRSDPIHAGGRPSFIVNALNFGFVASFDDTLSLVTSVDFLPRDHDPSEQIAFSDLIDIKLAFLRYELRASFVYFLIDAGKVDSVLGIEYRTQDSADRIMVTPSLVCRYTCGRPLGLRAIGQFFDRHFEVALAVTNGTSQVDNFSFDDQIDSNRFKTVSGRLAYRNPVFKGLELNVSGAIGPQDRQTDDSVLQWHLGVAGQLEVGDFLVVAEAVTGAAQGKSDTEDAVNTCSVASCLSYRAAYGLVASRATSFLRPYVRVDFRSARHRSGDDFAYVSDVLRATGGLNFTLGAHVNVKLEYTFNNELGQPQFPDDVFTSSLVVKY